MVCLYQRMQRLLYRALCLYLFKVLLQNFLFKLHPREHRFDEISAIHRRGFDVFCMVITHLKACFKSLLYLQMWNYKPWRREVSTNRSFWSVWSVSNLSYIKSIWTRFIQCITCLALHSINEGSPSNKASLTRNSIWRKSSLWVYLILIIWN